ncbi:Lipase GDSL [Macrophomina phaseolina MS6]|uniref:Lipase GDSL n=1 Tax=Macrophomina phaseolina (strain MS6) TaxID=1126212 RepID=K2T0N9_MACPH|nr:Lipase GDSL [Macrophomina phaseolina MS6]
MNATVKTPILVGNISTGSTLTYADVVSGSVVSEPGFYPVLNGTTIRGGDHLTIDPSQLINRINVDILVQTDDEPPEYIRMLATGTEEATQSVLDAVIGAPGAKRVPFGDFQATSSWSFQTGSEKYGELQNAVYVGSTSFRPGVEEGTFTIGFKVSKVVSVKTDISV